MQVLSHNSSKILNQQTENNINDNNKKKTNILLSFPIKTPLLIREASFIFFHVIFFSFFAFLSAGSSSRLICTGDFVWAAGKKADPQARGTQSPVRGARPWGDAENCSACFYTGNISFTGSPNVCCTGAVGKESRMTLSWILEGCGGDQASIACRKLRRNMM